MAVPHTTIPLFLASSAELARERELFELAVGRRNKLWRSQGRFLDLTVWETFLDTMHPGGLQQAYNAAAASSSLFVMVFATKVGPHTEAEFDAAFGRFQASGRPFLLVYYLPSAGAAKPSAADSASLQAFQRKLLERGHYQTRADNIDALLRHFEQQLDKLALTGFDTMAPAPAELVHILAVGPGGVGVQGSGNAVATGGSIANTGTVLGDINNTQVTNHIHPPAPNAAAAQANTLLDDYLRGLARQLAVLKLSEIDPLLDRTQRSPLQLPDIYVPLNTTHRLPAWATLAQPDAPKPAGFDKRNNQRVRLGGRDAGDTRPVSAIEALAHHRELTLLGAAGSGKSSFGARVLLALADHHLGQPAALQALATPQAPWPHGALLPLRIELRRLAQRHAGGTLPLRASELWAHLADELVQQGIATHASQALATLQAQARSQGALWLLDGLDECGPPAQAQRVLAGVRELIDHAPPSHRFILTARPNAWHASARPAPGVYALAEFDDAQVEQFIRAWYAALVTRGWSAPGADDAGRDELLRTWQRPDLVAMARNPLLLTQMAILHSNRGRLPEDRADLYRELVDLLLVRWTGRSGSHQSLSDALGLPNFRPSVLLDSIARVAFEVHRDQAALPDGHARQAAADIGEGRLLAALKRVVGGDLNKAVVAVDFIEQRAGLLIALPAGGNDGAERQFNFPHRTFQEYLAAWHLQGLHDAPKHCLDLARQAPAAWSVVLPLAARLAGGEQGVAMADRLICSRSVDVQQRPPRTADWHCALLAGEQLQELGPATLANSDNAPAVVARVAGWLQALLAVPEPAGGLPAPLRARAGDALAALGDPRFDPDRYFLPCGSDLGFVAVPAQPAYVIGTRRADRARVAALIGGEVPEHELNDKPVAVPAYQIARYPVTVAQFAAYVAATGNQPGDADALRGAASRPVAWVSWHEAMDYASWLTAQLRQPGRFDGLPAAELVRRHGWVVALPSELEWECAARAGRPGAVFPWGDTEVADAANTRRNGIGHACAVGCFAANDWGLYDSVGNVWQWTRSLWASGPDKPPFGYPYRPDDPKRELANAPANVSRLVRGGSWIHSADDARCAYRFGNRPDGRFDFLGFRVVLRSPLFS